MTVIITSPPSNLRLIQFCNYNWFIETFAVYYFYEQLNADDQALSLYVAIESTNRNILGVCIGSMCMHVCKCACV